MCQTVPVACRQCTVGWVLAPDSRAAHGSGPKLSNSSAFACSSERYEYRSPWAHGLRSAGTSCASGVIERSDYIISLRHAEREHATEGAQAPVTVYPKMDATPPRGAVPAPLAADTVHMSTPPRTVKALVQVRTSRNRSGEQLFYPCAIDAQSHLSQSSECRRRMYPS